MKFFRHLSMCLLLTGGVLLAGPTAGAQANPPAGELPEAYFPQRSFEFDPVIDGVKVVHDFALANRGAGTLLIENVKTG